MLLLYRRGIYRRRDIRFIFASSAVNFPRFIFNICEQLCNVFIYLHTQISTPIIYRDLKPEHIIVCHNKLKLIDFGVSTYVTRKGNNFNHYGNIEFSAPECFTEDTITPAADIYSLGQLLQYILTFTPDSFSHKFQHIIQKQQHLMHHCVT